MSMMMLDDRRKEWLMSTLLRKLIAKGTKPTLRHCLKRAFVKFDRNESGELDMEEFRLAMDEHLPGIDDGEFLALAASFDANGDGVVSIEEFVERLTEIHRNGDVDRATPGAHIQGQTQAPLKRRPTVSGTAYRQNSEFVDDGYNRKKIGYDDEDLQRAFLHLQERALQMCPDVAPRQLLLRAMERRKSTTMARHLTLPQFKDALSSFDLHQVDVLYKKCQNGDITILLDLFDNYINAAPQEKNEEKPKLSKSQQKTLKLKYLLLDKINDKAGPSFRVKLKRVVQKFDTDSSGELERSEFEKAFAELLPGVDRASVEALIDDIDLNRDDVLDVDEVATSLMKAQTSRTSTDLSLRLARKQPLYTKAGARGLS